MVLPPRNGLSLCAGAGGLDMGLMLAEPDFHTRCFVEWEEYPRRAIIAAQRAGYFAPAPIWDDLTTFDAKPLAGAFDTVLAGYPCQPFSMAGQRKGADDPRHLWPHVARIIRELGDGLEWVFLENVSGHASLGADAVLRELRDMGFTPAAGLFSAEETGAAHERLRWFCVAHRAGRGRGIGGHEAQPGRSGHIDGSDQPVANTDGGNPGTERQCSGGQQRFQPQGGILGARNVDDARCSQWGQGVAEGHHGDRQAPGWVESTSGVGKPSQHVDNAASPRCDAARIGAEADSQGGECLLGDGCDELADAMCSGAGTGARPHASPKIKGGTGWGQRAKSCDDNSNLADAGGAGREGREQPGSSDQRHGQAAHGSTAKCSGAQLFPPGPGDTEAWAAILAASPDRAPSFARRDAVAAAVNFASLLDPVTAQTLEPSLRGLSGTAQLGTLVEEAGAMVDQAEALARIRGVADGLAQRTRALRLLGNGVFPLAAAYAWRTLSTAHGLGVVDMAGTDESHRADAGGFIRMKNKTGQTTK